MRYSIGQVARMTGISTRTLRHYDDIDLLPPAEVASNGYRWYGRSELRRLQRILLLRDLRVPLDEIVTVLAGDEDEPRALRRHLDLIVAERDRLDRVAATVRRTLDDVEGRSPIPDDDFFTGLAERRAGLADTLTERFGHEATLALIDATRGTRAEGASSEVGTAHWDRADYDRAIAEARDLYARLARARAAGVDPASPTALDLVAEHYEAVRATWPADAAAYYALAELIEDDPDQRAAVGEVDMGLPDWLATAVRVYAVRRLGHHT